MPQTPIEAKPGPTRRISLLWMIVAWTIFAISALVFLIGFSSWLSEKTNLDPVVSNVLELMLVLITGFSWLMWLMIFSGIRHGLLLALVLVLSAVLFFINCRLVLDGDLGIVRVESRFLRREFEPVEEDATKTKVDLTNTTPGDFNQFLGSQRNAIVQGRRLVANWTATLPPMLWRQPIGEGWSGFSAVNGYAVTQEQRGKDECVSCYDIRSGELKWMYTADRRHEDFMALGKVGPRATPTIHEGRVYCQGATGILDCLDGADGQLIWSVDLANLLEISLNRKSSSSGLAYEYEDSRLFWGRSGSPLVYQDKVIITGGGPGDGPFSTLIAFDKLTGKEIWRGGDQMIAYGSPAVARLLGQDQITLVAESAAMGFDPESGAVLWTVEREGASNANANCSQVTRVSDDRILLTKGYQLGGQLVQLARDESGIKATSVWENSRVLKTKMMSPVIRDGYAYSLSDGYLECCDLRDGQQGNRVWRSRKRFGNGQLLLVGNHLLVHTETGWLKLVKATPDEYRELGEIRTIDGICWNTLCLYDRFLLVRSELEAACFELPMEEIPSVQSADLDKISTHRIKQADSEFEAQKR